MWKRLRYRRAQALVLLALAALVTTCAVFAPLFTRATQQALVRTDLASRPVETSGLQMRSDRLRSDGDLIASASPIPAPLRRQLGRPIRSDSADAPVLPETLTSPDGTIEWRDGFCAHLVVRGRCPRAIGEVLVSEGDVRHYGYAVGQRIVIGADSAQASEGGLRPELPLRVVGVYRQKPSAYWFGRQVAVSSGAEGGGPIASFSHDVWFTTQQTLHDSTTPVLLSEQSTDDYLLRRSATGVDELLAATATLPTLQRRADQAGIKVETGLGDVRGDVLHQRDQSRVTVPLLVGQLALLVVVVLWFVLGVATGQRRQEVAVALLRGSGRKGARWLLAEELLPPVLAGVPAGLGLALLLDVATVHLLPGGAPVELTASAVATAPGCVLVLGALTWLPVGLVTREGIDSLLRSVPARGGWRPGPGEIVLASVAGALSLAFASGALSGPFALVAPALLALLVGLVLATVVLPVAAWLGRRLLLRGRARLAISVLTGARGRTTRRTVVLVTVGVALVVFSADALAVGARNRESAAEQQVGAPMVAEVRGTDLAAVRRALARVDPGGRRATPVVRTRPAGSDGAEALAVVPDEFRRVALFPGQDASTIPWPRLAAPDVPPVVLRGTTLTGRLDALSLRVDVPGGGYTPVSVTLQVLSADNELLPVPLGKLRKDSAGFRFSRQVSCATGCRLVAVDVTTGVPASIVGDLRLSDVAANGTPVALRGSSWTSQVSASTGSVRSSGSSSSLTLSLRTTSSRTVSSQQQWLPQRVPALVTGSLPPGARKGRFTTTGIDSQAQPAVEVGRLPRIPSSGASAALVNLDVLERGRAVDPNSGLSIWFGSVDPALLRAVRTALADEGVALAGVATLSGTTRRFDSTIPAWALELGAAVGGAALLAVLLALLVIAVAGWRQRSRDLAALRMTGLRPSDVRRVAAAADVLVVLLAAIAGGVSGLLGAVLALPSVPLLARRPEVSTLDLSTAWVVVLASLATAALVAAVVVGAAGRAIAARSHLDRLREVL
ncbi:hypothetical protein GCM10011519_22010 [Marmoricola endophyticus]|uniref:ABC3 transporter permease C-terminal domain-containing protein n=1 Tax=Marmoricola endophyticus TaxID=2040280 RepID=A0A917F3T7_9ACTN|nr:FtsX-like permease family protein [Marmoricola endophyticus]GGF47559.1 hypothetical protein GCM10011519_22010 [Marmoricola endophyticus]